MRCPVCGRRVPSLCPVHGKVEVPEPDSSQVSGSTNPTFAGYRVERVVARGGFGTVFAAAPDGGGETVAIKLPRPDRPDARLCLVHEVQVLREVGTPHVPAVLGSGALGDGTPYVVMEYLTGRTLAERLLGRVDPLPLDEACTLALAVLAALEAVHDKGYIHRDLKPENVIVAEGGRRVTLVDFGLTAAIDPRGRTRDSTLGGAGVGTAEYMSPEQCEGRADIDARADIYAMGVMIFELCAGHPPFWGPRSVVCESHLSRRPPRLSASIPVTLGALLSPAGRGVLLTGIDEVVARCLAKDRADRYASVAALREALRGALAGGEGATTAAMPRALRAPGAPGARDGGPSTERAPLEAIDAVDASTAGDAPAGPPLRATMRSPPFDGHASEARGDRVSAAAPERLRSRRALAAIASRWGSCSSRRRPTSSCSRPSSRRSAGRSRTPRRAAASPCSGKDRATTPREARSAPPRSCSAGASPPASASISRWSRCARARTARSAS